MNRDLFLEYLTTALHSITTPRFYETERGFQGELLVELRKSLPDGFLPNRAIIEQEYQKRLLVHGLNVRPDIIVHEPFEPHRHGSRRDGNIAVIELKRATTSKRAAVDIRNLMRMMEVLEYPLAIFLNIASDVTHAELVPIKSRERIVCFAVKLEEGAVQVVQSGKA